MADPAGFGIVEKDATDFAALQTAFADAYALLQNPLTRNSPNVADKNDKKKAMIEAIRPLVNTIQWAEKGISTLNPPTFRYL